MMQLLGFAIGLNILKYQLPLVASQPALVTRFPQARPRPTARTFSAICHKSLTEKKRIRWYMVFVGLALDAKSLIISVYAEENVPPKTPTTWSFRTITQYQYYRG
jgi:hypothetical protein